MNSTKDNKFGIFSKNELIANVHDNSQRTALLGHIVRIKDVNKGKYVVQLLKENGKTWETASFYTPYDSLLMIHEKIWQFLGSVSSPQERIKLVKDKKKCDKLMKLTKDCQVGFIDVGDVLLGTIRYIGEVNGIGMGYGIQLHEKKKKNTCNGSIAGSQYFTCLPGQGIFTTIERIHPLETNSIDTHQTVRNDIDICYEKNMSSLFKNDSKPKYEEIVTKYGEYQDRGKSFPQKNITYMRNSLSLQDMLDVEGLSVNTNNDFDQNTVIQPDKFYLVKDTQKKPKVKSEVDLIDVIGGTWSGATEKKELDECNYTKLRNQLDKNENFRDKPTKNKIVNTLKKNSRFYIDENGCSDVVKEKNSFLRREEPNKKINERSEQVARSTFYVNEKPKYTEPQPGTTNDLTVGTLVEVLNDISEEPLYGVVRWMGVENGCNFILVGVELEEEQSHLPLELSDGVYKGERFFKCAENRALFVPLQQCHKDSRFQDGAPTPTLEVPENNGIDCPVIKGSVSPLCMPTEEDVEAVCGKYRGIQGHHNSCYLDVTLFSMFTYTSVFDSLLFRPKNHNDIDDYEEVQRVLREEIVNPLRKNLYVSADHVMKLRKLLDRLSSVSGLTSEEKDPEEFLNSLLAQILKAEPYLKLSSGQEAFHYQLFVEKDADLTLPTVQQLFDQSFFNSNIKLKEVPSCLIIQMPRFGKTYKVYPRILPSQLLDVTDIIEGSPRQCNVCGKLAKWECHDCFDVSSAGLESTGYCKDCLKTAHRHEKRQQHRPVKLEVSQDFSIMEEHCRPPRLFMELFAVICIETSHYVAFVKCGVGHEAPWCFFDSMADRQGEKNGFNIPEMVACPDISQWLSDDSICRKLHDDFENDRHLPEHARRLLCDAYICMYQSSDVMMYR